MIICGDFGGIWDGSEAEQQVLDWLENRPFTTLFVDGNHENFDLLHTCPVQEWHGERVQVIRPSVLHLTRGQVYEISGKRIFTMGGASSHDIRDGSLFIFPQHKDEIIDILRNFRDRDAYSTKPSQSLERLEAERFTTIEIDQEIQSLTAILWIKYAMRNKSIPRLWLVSAANAAVSPTASVMGKFYEITVRMSKKGDLTDDEAANLRYSTYARAEIMSACGGNPDVLDDTSVLAVQERVKKKYIEKEIVVTAAAKADAERAKQDRDIASQKLISSQSEIQILEALLKDSSSDA